MAFAKYRTVLAISVVSLLTLAASPQTDDEYRPVSASDERTPNLNETMTEPVTLAFEAGKTQVVAGTLTLQGTATTALALRSSIANQQWNIDPQGNRAVAYVDVRESNNVNALAINPASSHNLGNNTNWWTVEPTDIAIAWADGTTGQSEGQTGAVVWNMGQVSTGAERMTHPSSTTGNNQDCLLHIIVRNSGTVAEKLSVACGNAGAFTVGPQVSNTTFEMGVNTVDDANYSALDAASGVQLSGVVNSNQAQALYLRFKAPTRVSNGPLSITLSITATAP